MKQVSSWTSVLIYFSLRHSFFQATETLFLVYIFSLSYLLNQWIQSMVVSVADITRYDEFINLSIFHELVAWFVLESWPCLSLRVDFSFKRPSMIPGQPWKTLTKELCSLHREKKAEQIYVNNIMSIPFLLWFNRLWTGLLLFMQRHMTASLFFIFKFITGWEPQGVHLGILPQEQPLTLTSSCSTHPFITLTCLSFQEERGNRSCLQVKEKITQKWGWTGIEVEWNSLFYCSWEKGRRFHSLKEISCWSGGRSEGWEESKSKTRSTRERNTSVWTHLLFSLCIRLSIRPSQCFVSTEYYKIIYSTGGSFNVTLDIHYTTQIIPLFGMRLRKSWRNEVTEGKQVKCGGRDQKDNAPALLLCLTNYQLDFYISLQQRPTGKRYTRKREDAQELLVFLSFTHHDPLLPQTALQGQGHWAHLSFSCFVGKGYAHPPESCLLIPSLVTMNQTRWPWKLSARPWSSCADTHSLYKTKDEARMWPSCTVIFFLLLCSSLFFSGITDRRVRAALLILFCSSISSAPPSCDLLHSFTESSSSCTMYFCPSGNMCGIWYLFVFPRSLH